MGSYFISGCNFPSLSSPETKWRTKGTEKLSGEDIFYETYDSSFPTDTTSPGIAKATANSRASPGCDRPRQPAPGRAGGRSLTWLSQTRCEGCVKSHPSPGSWVKCPCYIFQPAIRVAKIALVHSVPFDMQPPGAVPLYTNTETTKEQGHQT